MSEKKELPLALLQILTRYTDANHVLTNKAINEILNKEYGLSMERRTMYANFDILAKYGFKIGIGRENGMGFYLTDHLFNKDEAELLLDLITSSNSLSPQQRHILIGKILSTMSEAQQQDYMERLSDLTFSDKEAY